MLSEFNPARLHPLLVHLPIGLLFFALIMEGLQKWSGQQPYRSAIRLCLLFGVGTAIFSALSGWGLATEGGYDQTVLDRHRWLGVGVAIGAALTYWSHLTTWRPLQQSYFPLLLITNITLLLAGHYGGAMTHGADYLFSHPVEQKTVVDIEEAGVYEVVVAPVLTQKCVSCHKASKSKGELRLDEPELILAGGESGAVFDKVDPAKSLLLERIHLPLDVEEHMPPEGKPQLSTEELLLLRWWIENGHCFDCKVKDLPHSPELELALASYEAPQDHWSKLDMKPVTAGELAKLKKAGIRAMPLAEGSPFLFVDLARRKDINRSLLRELRPVRKRLVVLSAGFSDFSDAEADFLANCPNLRKLELQGTAITDKSLRAIQELEHLESLNLYNTAVTDAGLQQLAEMESLQKLYLWQSEVSPGQVLKVGNQDPELEILFALDDSIFGRSALNPPVLEAATTLFHDSIIVRLKTNIKDIRAYYTLDGTEPDTNSLLLGDSLLLRASAHLKVMQTKAGWLPSPVSEKRLVKAGVRIEEADLLIPASGKYTASGARSLIDLQKGSSSFTDGKWLGYEGKHMAARLDLGKDRPVASLVISTLSRPASWIFFPTGAKIYSSLDGQSFQLLKEERWPIRDKEVADEEMSYLKVNLPENTTTRYLKVEIESPLRNPVWHPNPGGNSWIFIDEILVD